LTPLLAWPNLPHPQELKATLQEHLRLQYTFRGADDKAMLASLPTTLKRRVLRHEVRGGGCWWPSTPVGAAGLRDTQTAAVPCVPPLRPPRCRRLQLCPHNPPQHGATLAKCPLLKGVNAKFIDALLCAATIETYMPRVDILADGGGCWGGEGSRRDAGGKPEGSRREGRVKGGGGAGQWGGGDHRDLHAARRHPGRRWWVCE
jgi:hypothetical protein